MAATAAYIGVARIPAGATSSESVKFANISANTASFPLQGGLYGVCRGHLRRRLGDAANAGTGSSDVVPCAGGFHSERVCHGTAAKRNLSGRGGLDGKANQAGYAQKRRASGLGWPKFPVGTCRAPRGAVRPALLRSDGAHRYSRFEAEAPLTEAEHVVRLNKLLAPNGLPVDGPKPEGPLIPERSWKRPVIRALNADLSGYRCR
jgi:hypothetical protein